MAAVALIVVAGMAGAIATPVDLAVRAASEPSKSIAQHPRLGAVYAPGTDPSDIGSPAAALPSGPQRARVAARWFPQVTALNNGGFLQGDALELTWSIIPDGTTMPAQGDDDTTCTSNLIAQFDANYGAGNWQAEIQAVWDNWTSLTGNVYTPAVPLDPDGTPIDDGAVWPDTRGLANVRGDIRIGGCDIDGDSNTLAYNFFPNTGDMKIDATDVFFQTTNLTTAFHNVFSHEHGHGVGLDHVCPINGTKLMEPVINLGFRGLQHDDIRGVQRGYGDRFELIDNPNDTAGAATPLTLEPAQSEQQLSLDSTGDVDWFTFDANVRDTLTVSVIPNGLVYPEGPDPGLCSGGPGSVSSLDSRAIQDLAFEIRDATGVVATVDGTGAGAAESISDFVIPATGTYFVRVLGTGTDDAQLYDLSVRKDLAPPMDFGDAPVPYPTRFVDDGARHGDQGVFLGATVDALEPDGLPSPDALGDDDRDSDDEDGVDFTSPVRVGATTDVEVTLTGPSSPMDAWIDFNRDGDWTDPGEQIFDARVIQTGANDLTFAVPPGAGTGSTYARFRVSSAGGLSPSGPAPDGEVEDHRIDIVDVPGAPTGVTATAGDAVVDVAWTASASDGGSPIIGYTAVAAPGGAMCTTSTATDCRISGLTNGTSYTVTVTAANDIGIGPSSAPSTPATPNRLPGSPTAVAAAPGNTTATVSWTAPASSGGSPITGYAATAAPGGATCTTTITDCTIDGLTNGTTYTVTVTATNALGVGPASAPSPPVTPRTVPTAPAEVTAVPGNGSIDVAWAAPASDGGSPVTGYTAVASPGGATCSTTTLGCTVGGLTNGVGYTLTVTATNDAGTSPASTPSGSVTPVGPIAPPTADVVTVEPGRFLDTRPTGDTIDDQFQGAGKVQADTFTRIQIAGRGGVADDAVGVEVNITAIQNEGRGFATLYPCTPTPPTASTLNYTPGINIANATTVALNTAGEICLYTNTTAHYALDVLAYIPAESDVATVEPGRLLDTRTDGSTIDGQFLGAGKLPAGQTIKVQIAGRGGVADDAVGVEVNITAIQNEGRGFATLYPCTPTPPTASTLNYTPGINIANATTVALNTAGEICLYTNTTAHYALDVLAYIPAESDVSTVVEPGRLLDTRTDGSTIDDQFHGAGKVQADTFTRIQIAGRGGVADDAVGVEVNITAIQNEGRGFATLYPCTPDTTHRLHPQLHTRHQHRQRHHRRPQHRRRNLPLHQHHRPLRPRHRRPHRGDLMLPVTRAPSSPFDSGAAARSTTSPTTPPPKPAVTTGVAWRSRDASGRPAAHRCGGAGAARGCGNRSGDRRRGRHARSGRR